MEGGGTPARRRRTIDPLLRQTVGVAQRKEATMGLLDELLGGLAQGGLDQAMGRQAPRGRGGVGPQQAGPQAGGMSSVLIALLPVILSMLANRGGGGGLGGSIGGRSGTEGGMGDLGGLGSLGGGMGGRSGTGGGMGDPGGLGGLGGLLEQFQRMGYADQANSWVGTGANQPISPDIVAQVFGRDGLSQIASHAGLTESEASVGLSQILPDVVDRLTPQGQMPDLDSLVASVDDLERRFRG
jgi:uncharacterized protein YidB (DUF937 family)